MQSYPGRLISSSEKCNIVVNQSCGECLLIHRAMTKDSLTTIGGEIDPEFIDLNRFCTLSINSLFCESHHIRHITDPIDVKFNISENKKELAFADFESNDQIPETVDIKFVVDEDYKVIGFKRKAIEAIRGKYPFSKKQKKTSEEEFEFKIIVLYKPTPVNAFHFELRVLGTHPIQDDDSREFKMLKGETTKKVHLRAIISKIKNRIIKDRSLIEVTKKFAV